MVDPVALTQDLIRCPSVTPEDAGSQTLLANRLQSLGFTVHHLRFGDAPDGPVDNLVAVIGEGAPHFAFAGHTDVVPAGDLAGWSLDPFAATIADGQLVGRGAADMKGAIAAMVAAAARHVARGAPGRLSFIITGDEEGPALHGTRALIDYMAAQGHQPDLCLVGEPTSVNRLGDMVKIGRRGSVNIFITAEGTQGHVAYPHLADNPLPKLVAILAELDALTLDTGTAWFQPSNLEITDINVGNPAHNVIPAKGEARISIRFNDLHTGKSLSDRVCAIAAKHGGKARPDRKSVV